MYHISVFPSEFSWALAKASSGCTCTERRSEVKMNFTSKGRSASNQTSPILFWEEGNQGARSWAPQTFSRNLVGRRTGALALTDETSDAVEAALQFFHGCRVGNADVLVGSESFAGNDGHVGFGEQTLGELQGRRDSFAETNGDVGIGVESTLGFGDLDAGNRTQPFHHEIAALAI